LPVRILVVDVEISDEEAFWERVLSVAGRPAS